METTIKVAVVVADIPRLTWAMIEACQASYLGDEHGEDPSPAQDAEGQQGTQQVVEVSESLR